MTKLSSKLAASARAAVSPESPTRVPATAPARKTGPTSRRPRNLPADTSPKEAVAPRFPAPRRVWPD